MWAAPDKCPGCPCVSPLLATFLGKLKAVAFSGGWLSFDNFTTRAAERFSHDECHDYSVARIRLSTADVCMPAKGSSIRTARPVAVKCLAANRRPLHIIRAAAVLDGFARESMLSLRAQRGSEAF